MSSGKATNIISRFPHFYAPEDPNSPLHQFVEVFAAMLEQAEGDLVQVLRSRFVDTANNLDSQGFMAAQKGDLDRILALYLEQLGGTSQLNLVNQTLQEADVQQAEALIQSLLAASHLPQPNAKLQPPPNSPEQAVDRLTQFLWQQLPSKTRQLLQRYNILNATFPANLQISSSQAVQILRAPEGRQSLQRLPLSQPFKQSLKEFNQATPNIKLTTGQIQQLQQELVFAWLIHLRSAPDPLTQFLRNCLDRQHQQDQSTTLPELAAYSGEIPVPIALTAALAQDLNQAVLPHRQVYRYVQARLDQLTVHLNLLKCCVLPFQDVDLTTRRSLQSTLGHFLYNWLQPDTQRALSDLSHPSLSPQEQQALVNLLHRQLPTEIAPLWENQTLSQTLLTQLAADQTLPAALPFTLSEAALHYLIQAAQTTLGQRLSCILSYPQLNTQLELLQRLYPAQSSLQQTQTLQVAIDRHFYPQLSPRLQTWLTNLVPGGEAETRSLAQRELQSLLLNPDAQQALLSHLEQVTWSSAAVPTSARSETALLLLTQATQAVLSQQLSATCNSLTANLLPIPPDLQQRASENLSGDDLKRLNRMLLELSYPLLLPASQIPSRSEICQELVTAFNRKILPNRNFYSQNQSSFAHLSLHPEVQRLITHLNTQSDTFSDKQLTRLNRLLLESIYPTQLTKADTPYRDRLKRLIQVLKNGASTRDGIVDIVAANLGMSRTQDDATSPWEKFLFEFSLEHEFLLHQPTVSTPLRQLFRDQGVPLVFGATIVLETPDRSWLITDAMQEQAYRVQKQKNSLQVYQQLIRVIEFLPEAKTQSQTICPYPKQITKSQSRDALPHPALFTIHNPNLTPLVPAIQVKIRDCRPEAERFEQRQTDLPSQFQVTLDRNKRPTPELLCQLGLATQETAEIEVIQPGQEWQITVLTAAKRQQYYRIKQKSGNLKVYQERTIPPLLDLSLVNWSNETFNSVITYKGMLKAGEVIQWLPDGTVLINGMAIDQPQNSTIGGLPSVPVGSSTWSIAAFSGSDQAKFDTTLFDFSQFDRVSTLDLTVGQASSYALEVAVTFYQFTPGHFMVKIPWDIPGYTDRFDETPDHPRHQISGLIEKVRASGVDSVISYEKYVEAEVHEMQDQLNTTEISLAVETRNPYSPAIVHEMTERCLTAAVFDYTCFDSLNGLS